MAAYNGLGLALIWLLVPAFVAYLLILTIYRLVFSPLSGVPGPRIAAVTGWCEFYWDCPRKGHYMFKIEEMHEKYGPIVRISPWEVHINDPAYWDELYSNNKLDKYAWYYRAFGDNLAAVGTGPADLHQARRKAMARYFSSANVSKLEPKVLSRVQKLCDRVDEHRQAGKVISTSDAYRCFATDVISDYAAPHTRDFLSTPDFSASFCRFLRDFSEIMLWHRHIPIVIPVIGVIQRSVTTLMGSTGANVAVIEHQAGLLRQARTVIETKGIPSEKSSPTILDAIYTSPYLRHEDKSLERLMSETQALLGAGTETTGNTLSLFTYHVLSKAPVLKKLKAELKVAAGKNPKSNPLDYSMLEKLPYLQACIKEALRLGTGVVGRLPRLNPTAPMSYTTPAGKTYAFLPNAVLSMSVRDLHLNESIFDYADAFWPERWLDSNEGKLRQMGKYFVPFGRGIRACLGLELAKQEITLMAGNLIHRFDLELFETTDWDVSVQHDYFAPFGPKDSKGVRVVAK